MRYLEKEAGHCAKRFSWYDLLWTLKRLGSDSVRAQVEAYRGSIIMPNRHNESHGNMYEGHLLASETYVGGHVEALEAGVFRSDIPSEFKIDPAAVQRVRVSYLSFTVLHRTHLPKVD